MLDLQSAIQIGLNMCFQPTESFLSTDSQTLKTNLWLPEGTGGGGGMDGGFGTGIWNGWPIGTCHIAQGRLPNIL